LTQETPRSRNAGTADLVAGAAGALFAPVATFWLGIPFWISIPIAVLIFVGVRLLLAPRKLFEGFDFSEADQASLALAREVLEQARLDLDALAGAAAAIKNALTKKRLMHLHQIAVKVTDEVEKRPARINNVRRLLTYYLPGAAKLAAGYRTLEDRMTPNQQRVQAAEQMIGQLDGVFTSYADRLTEQDIEGLDLEIKLLEGEISGERKR